MHDADAVVVGAGQNGLVAANLLAADAEGAYAWLTRLARGLGGDDPRTMDARRADLLAALLNGLTTRRYGGSR